MKTSVSNTMELADEKSTLDQNVVNLFSHKSVLAILMKYCVREFKGLSADFIAENCFVGSPVVRKIAVDRDVPDTEELPIEFQGLEEEEPESESGQGKIEEPDGLVSYDAVMLDGNERIQGMDTVDKTQREGTAIYDIIFLAKVPRTNEIIQLIINVEIQNDQNLNYYVETRGIFYCARMISAQKNRTFMKSEYGKIRKVYSIWICPYARNGKNTVTAYTISAKDIYGGAKVPKEAYDKMEMVVITLNAEGLKSENELIKYLSLLLNHEVPVEERERILETEYHLQMTEEIKEVETVCNYSEALLQRGINQGEDNMRKLYKILSRAGRMEDYDRSMDDDQYREKLYSEYGIKKKEDHEGQSK